MRLESNPDSEGIKTLTPKCLKTFFHKLESNPDSEGIKTVKAIMAQTSQSA